MIDEVVSHYHILEQISSGGMGVVYKAEDVRLHRLVALKFMPDDLAGDPLFVARFQREARAASALSHPNICTIYDVGEEGGRPFIAMEYLAGTPLNRRITGCPMPMETVLSLATDIAAGLGAAHAKGIIHRDIKPGNIFVVDAVRAKILDFGLAKMCSKDRNPQARRAGSKLFSAEPVTDPGTTIGTVDYMSPEQARGEVLDERTDLFSFGAVLYEMVTGKSPFHGDTPALIFDAILNQEPPSPSRANPFLSPNLEEVIHKALVKDRESRYQHASEMRADLQLLDMSEMRRSEATTIETGAGNQLELAAAASPGSALARVVVRQRGDSAASTIGLPRAVPAAAPGKSGTRLPAIAIMLTMILLGAVAAYWWRTREWTTPASTDRASVAVLPFVNLNPHEAEDYFSDGLTEELINDLAKVPGIKVVARASAFQFKGKSEDLRTIGRKLGVAKVLEGTVRCDGSHLRVHADLTSTQDGFQLWSETYDRNIDDAFAVQEEIARAATRALKVKLLRADDEAHSGNHRPSAEAYQAYLQGKYFNGRGQAKEDLEQALAFTDRAIALDAKYAPAWAQRSEILSTMGMVTLMDNTDAHRRAQHDAEQAIALDPELSDGYIALATQQMADDRDWEGAQASLKKAAELEPGSVQLMGARAQLLRTLGRIDESIDLAKRAAAIDPLRARIFMFLGNLLYYAGRYEEADAATKEALELNPQASAVHTIRAKMFVSQGRLQDALAEMELEPMDWNKYTGLAIVYHALGRSNDSQSELEQLITTHKSDCAYQIAEVYEYRGDADNAFEWLNRAYDQRDAGLRDLKIDPLFKGLRKDPRFEQLLRKMRLES